MNMLFELLNENFGILEKKKEAAEILNNVLNQNTVGTVVSFLRNNGFDKKVEELIPFLHVGNRMALEDVLNKRIVASYS